MATKWSHKFGGANVSRLYSWMNRKAPSPLYAIGVGRLRQSLREQFGDRFVDKFLTHDALYEPVTERELKKAIWWGASKWKKGNGECHHQAGEGLARLRESSFKAFLTAQKLQQNAAVSAQVHATKAIAVVSGNKSENDADHAWLMAQMAEGSDPAAGRLVWRFANMSDPIPEIVDERVFRELYQGYIP